MSVEEIKLLIVDDDDAIRFSFSDYFEDQGLDVRVAMSGEEALEVLEDFDAQVAIVDIRMGGISGDEFIRQAIVRYPYCRYIICTGSPDYGAPTDLVNLQNVHRSIFSKPVTDLMVLKEAVIGMI